MAERILTKPKDLDAPEVTQVKPLRDDVRWGSLDQAPRDGSPVWIWIVHPLARYCKDPIAEGYEAACRAEWIDHNGGGWTWCWLAGTPTKWMPRTDGLNIYGDRKAA